MAIDVVSLDRAIAKLQELRRLASDPEVAVFLKNGNGASSKQETKVAYDTALGTQIAEAVEEIGGSFTVKGVYEKIKDKYEFRGSEPHKSVANVLRAMARDGKIKIKIQGKGRREMVYGR